MFLFIFVFDIMQALRRAFKCNLLCYLFNFFSMKLCCVFWVWFLKRVTFLYRSVVIQTQNGNKDTNLIHLMSSLLTDHLSEEWMIHVQPWKKKKICFINKDTHSLLNENNPTKSTLDILMINNTTHMFSISWWGLLF